jgi:hypothetical protein
MYSKVADLRVTSVLLQLLDSVFLRKLEFSSRCVYVIKSHACLACCRRSTCSGCACSIAVCVCVQVCVHWQTCAIVYVRAATVRTTFCSVHVSARAASMCVRVDRLWNLHTQYRLTIRSIPLCTVFLVALKDRALRPSICTDPRATRQIGTFTWASVHSLSALLQISPLADELFRTSKSKIAWQTSCFAQASL